MISSASVSTAGGTTVITLAGEIDMATGDLLRDAFTEATALAAADGRSVVIDLAEVTFIDSTGIGLVLEGRRNAIDAGATVVVRNARDRTLRTLQMTGLEVLLDLDADEG